MIRSDIQGFTLLEILVALFVLSLGLLGLAALQVTSLSLNTDAYTRTQATAIAYDIIDKMRANPTGVANGDYDVDTAADADAKVGDYDDCKDDTCKCQDAATSCDSPTLALYDLGTWYEKMKESLPDSNSTGRLATIGRDAATNLVTIEIKWLERDLPKAVKWQVQL